MNLNTGERRIVRDVLNNWLKWAITGISEKSVNMEHDYTVLYSEVEIMSRLFGIGLRGPEKGVHFGLDEYRQDTSEKEGD